MPNEDMIVIGAIARKGGAGKTTVLKALISACIAAEKRCLALDTDPQRALFDWAEHLNESGAGHPLLVVKHIERTDQVEQEINAAYEGDLADFVFIDTPGEGGDWADEVAIQCDHIVTPIMLSDTDMRIGQQTLDWFERLKSRADDPILLPKHHAVLNRVRLKTTKGDDELLVRATSLFPVINTLILDRNQYVEMDRHGLLHDLARQKSQDKNALVRVHAKHFYEALEEAKDVLNEILAG